MITWHPDFLYSFDLNSLDNDKIFKESFIAENYLKQIIKTENPDPVYGSFTTGNFSNYNILCLPLRETSKLYREIRNYCFPFLNVNEDYWIQSWVNIFRKGKNIDWHGHWDPEFNVFHGFYCVNVGESYTEYKLPNVGKIIKVPSKEGRLVFGKSGGDQHRSSIWESDTPRITIAFDIVPFKTFTMFKSGSFEPNHYIPFK
tara:strand:- start:1968 stop:2570 length:603 start_codon:yes stop_codon:yes gene_type:complete